MLVKFGCLNTKVLLHSRVGLRFLLLIILREVHLRLLVDQVEYIVFILLLILTHTKLSISLKYLKLCILTLIHICILIFVIIIIKITLAMTIIFVL